MFKRILIANRGEIACRIMATARRMGVQSVAVYSEVDVNALHVRQADSAVCLGGAALSESYLNTERIIAAAVASGAQAIHPGYGFLSENAEFVDAVNSAGLVFIGPSATAIRAMGLKDAAKSLMQQAGVPVVPGYHGAEQAVEHLAAQAKQIGFPLLIKARSGGGGKGMRRVESFEEFEPALASAAREGLASFGDAAVLLERYISKPRHIEIQVFADNFGNVVHMFERDCSLQRRHQKVIEEAPAPDMPVELRDAMTSAATTAAKAIEYRGAGTVEFIVDGSNTLSTDGFWFMEMNTRLQVEHPVTEAITDVDLVEAQLMVAANQPLPFVQSDLNIRGHSIEARVYAEDVRNNFMPVSGVLQNISFGEGVRIDTGVESGDSISPFFDPMIAKLTAWGSDRSIALNKLRTALQQTHIAGTITNIEFLATLLQHDGFAKGEVDTGLIERELDDLVALAEPSLVTQLIAALYLFDINPLAPLCGWRLFGRAEHLVCLQCKQTEYKLRLAVNGACCQLLCNTDNKILLDVEFYSFSDSTCEFSVSGSLRTCATTFTWSDNVVRSASVLIDGSAFEFSKTATNETSESQQASGDVVYAPMSGIITSVLAEAGQSVTAGSTVIVMEAMKMETTLKAPRDGVVDVVNTKVGDSVNNAEMLLRLES